MGLDRDSEVNSESDSDSNDSSESDSDSEDNLEPDCDSEKNLESTVDHQTTRNVVRSQYYDVMVKVDADVYCLDKLQLAWKSDYFEKLLIEYSDQKECSLFELPLIDTNTFSVIVDIIYGKTLKSVLNHDNHITLLMAMDYLQMEIDLKTYADFFGQKSDRDKNSIPDTKIFRLYNFVPENPNLQCLLPSVLKYSSVHLSKMQIDNDFLSLPLEHVVQIVSSETDCWDKKRKISQICSEWIFYDLHNRLPHTAKLVNAANRRFNYRNEINDEDFNTMLSKISGQVNLETMTKLFYKFLLCDGELNPAQENLLLEDEDDQVSILSSNKDNERKKLTKLLENGHFHDIVVNVGEKTYKLHKFMLNPASGYFAEISSTKQSNAECAEASAQQQQPNQNEYLLHDVDQTTFDMIIKYIYFDDEVPLTLETVTRVLRTANTLKMEKLFDGCLCWMQKNIEQFCTEVLMIDECFSTSWIRNNIKEISLKVLIEPEIGDTLPICSVPFDMLEDLLLLSSDCCDNPHKIVDICSKWVMHDVENRHHLVPQIVLAINRNRNYYEIDVSADLYNCTEELIRDELWNILHSTVLLPSTTKISENCEKKFHEKPVFVALTRETSSIHVLNANLEQIFSLYLSNDTYFNCVTATLIGDNLFIASSNESFRFVFHGVNLSSKRFVSLNRNIQAKNDYCCSSRFWLLNCRGQVYCCCARGHVLKYSTELNRWMLLFSDTKLEYYDKWFTSDGDKLYRLYADGMYYAAHEFNFEQNVWSSVPDLSFKSDRERLGRVRELTILGDGQFTAVFKYDFMSFDQNSKKWRQFSLTENDFYYEDFEKCFLLTQCEGRLIHVFGNKLYHWSERSKTWELKKELPSRFESSVPSKYSERRNPCPYKCISVIHRTQC